ncbi:MAG: hypothetical protein JST82_06195 [Bacteroidetes bacterium]|nr:hypothetical protein [Bacteroidota bacterium]
MKSLKLFLLATVLVASYGTTALAQDHKKDTKKEEKKMEMKEHVCTAACKDGKHMYAHGEKGHTCTDACKKEMKKK